FELVEKELRKLVYEISFPNNINKLENFILSKLINPETTNEQIIELRKFYHEIRNIHEFQNYQEHFKNTENKSVPGFSLTEKSSTLPDCNKCDDDVPNFSSIEKSLTLSNCNNNQQEKQSKVNNPVNKTSREKKRKPNAKSSSSNNRRRNVKNNLPGIIKIYPKTIKGCYEMDKFDSNDNTWYNSTSSSVIHSLFNIDFPLKDNILLDTQQQHFYSNDSTTFGFNHYENSFLYYPM
ncbi:2317_t:CDS:2, partial [Scutellospora calospora]